MKTLEEKKEERMQKIHEESERIWDVWEDDTIVPWKPKDAPRAITAPKRDLPTHAESYNPADEYLLDDQELK
jgi:ribosome biogenesis protein ERB1